MRPEEVSSPNDAEYWLATIDYSLIGFDKSKRNKGTVPICLDPSSLLQTLEFWLPRDEGFEQSIYDSIRMPLMVQDFDNEAEDVSLDILTAISRYEDVGDIPQGSVANILSDDATRANIQSLEEDDPDEKLEIVSSSLTEEARRLEEDVEEKEAEIEKKEEKYESKVDEMQETIETLLRKKEHYEEKVDEKSAEKEELGDQNTKLEFVLFETVIPMTFGLVFIIIANYLLYLFTPINAFVSIAFPVLAFLVFYLSYLHNRGEQYSFIRQKTWYQWLGIIKNSIATLVGLLIFEIVVNLVSSYSALSYLWTLST